MATAKKTAKAATPARKSTPAKTRSRSTAKPTAKPVPVPAQAAAPVAAKAPKAEKPKKPKLVRDSFTIPTTEYAGLEQVKQRAAKSGAPAKKSELLRAGIKALAAMGDPAFLAALGTVPAIKTGRPAKA